MIYLFFFTINLLITADLFHDITVMSYCPINRCLLEQMRHNAEATYFTAAFMLLMTNKVYSCLSRCTLTACEIAAD